MESSSGDSEKTVVEVVTMLDDGTLKIAYSVSMLNGPRPNPRVWTSAPGSPDFLEFGKRHGVTKPGQTSTITKEFRDGEWTERLKRDGVNW